MTSNDLISIITVNYNGVKDTCEMIDSILHNISFPYEIIVVDNASKIDETVEIRNRFPNVIAIRSEINLGFAAGNNIGIKAAKGNYLFFLNNDTIIKDNNIFALIERLNKSDKIGVVSPKIKFNFEPNNIQFAGYTRLTNVTLRNSLIGYEQQDSPKYNIASSTPYIHGAAFMMKKEVVDKVGLMPEIFFLYYEELDWSEIIIRAGYELWYEPSFTVYHKESQSTGINSPLKIFYLNRNRLLYAKRNRFGLIRYLSYLYQIFIALPKQNLLFILHGKISLTAVSIKGVLSFCSLLYKH